MRVLIVNTSELTGGAAVAANRLKDALINSGEKAKMLVRDKSTDDITVVKLRHSWRQRWNFLWERWCLFVRLRFSWHNLFQIDMANAGTDITRLPEFKEADIIHLHWINQGMLSLKNIRKILDSGKPVVWTMHDIWPATALCHLTLGCQYFKTQCHNCRYLPTSHRTNGNGKDFSTRIWQRKMNVLKDRNIWFVACSRWLAGEAKKSALLAGQRIYSIPNPIDMRTFCRKDKKETRERLGLPAAKRLVLFASQKVTNVNKGMTFLIEACGKLAADDPDMVKTMGVLILGAHAEEMQDSFPCPTYPLGYVNDSTFLVDIYNAADVFVLPSLSENLPNTIMESMACGVPCVGFNVGGISEMIDHRQNGYVAKYRDVDDLAAGIRWVLHESNYEELSHQAVRKVATSYSEQSVALRYTEVYYEAMAHKAFNV